MRPGLAELERRQSELRARCAAERDAAAAAAGDLRAQVQPYDAALGRARRWLASPAVIGAGIAAALLLGRRRGWRRIGSTVGLVSTALQLRGLLG